MAGSVRWWKKVSVGYNLLKGKESTACSRYTLARWCAKIRQILLCPSTARWSSFDIGKRREDWDLFVVLSKLIHGHFRLPQAGYWIDASYIFCWLSCKSSSANTMWANSQVGLVVATALLAEWLSSTFCVAHVFLQRDGGIFPKYRLSRLHQYD